VAEGGRAKFLRIVSILERLPYGASRLEEGLVAWTAVGSGTLLMALGSALFAVGWWRKLNALMDVAFVVTLLGWMLLIISSAFLFVTTVAKKFPGKGPRKDA
jgi:hypothetical protein